MDSSFSSQNPSPEAYLALGSHPATPGRSSSLNSTADIDGTSSTNTRDKTDAVIRQPRPRGRPPTRQPQIDGQLRFPCEYRSSDGIICHKSFNRKSDRERHHHTHTNTRNHPCSLCDKAFIQTSALKVHVRTHTKEKPHHCGICQKRFSDSSSLARHRRTHEPPQFTCTWCSAKYKTSQLLQRHERKCSQYQIDTSQPTRHISTQPGAQPEHANFDHTNHWQPTIVTSHAAPRRSPSSIPMNNSNVQYAGANSEHSSHYQRSQTHEEPQLDQNQSESQMVNVYTPTSSFASESHSQDMTNSSHMSPGTIPEEVQPQDVRNVSEYASQPQHMIQPGHAPLLHFQTNMDIPHCEYGNMFHYSQRPEDSAHAIYLDDEPAQKSPVDYHDGGVPQPMSVAPPQPLPHYNTAPGLEHGYYSLTMNFMDPYKICNIDTGSGDVLPSKYDMSQGW